MGILDRNFEKAIGSTEAALIRGKMGTEKGNQFIQDTHNRVYNGHHCGYDVRGESRNNKINY